MQWHKSWASNAALEFLYILVATFNFLAVTEAEKLAISRMDGKTYLSGLLKQNIILIHNADISNEACLYLRLEL